MKLSDHYIIVIDDDADKENTYYVIKAEPLQCSINRKDAKIFTDNIVFAKFIVQNSVVGMTIMRLTIQMPDLVELCNI